MQTSYVILYLILGQGREPVAVDHKFNSLAECKASIGQMSAAVWSDGKLKDLNPPVVGFCVPIMEE